MRYSEVLLEGFFCQFHFFLIRDFKNAILGGIWFLKIYFVTVKSKNYLSSLVTFSWKCIIPIEAVFIGYHLSQNDLRMDYLDIKVVRWFVREAIHFFWECPILELPYFELNREQCLDLSCSPTHVPTTYIHSKKTPKLDSEDQSM